MCFAFNLENFCWYFKMYTCAHDVYVFVIKVAVDVLNQLKRGNN